MGYIDLELEAAKAKLRELPIETFIEPGQTLYELREKIEEAYKEDLFDYMSYDEFAEFIAQEYDIIVQEVLTYEISRKAQPGHGRVIPWN